MPAASTSESHSQRLEQIDLRHDELITQIDDLNGRIEAALNGLTTGEVTSSAPASPTC